MYFHSRSFKQNSEVEWSADLVSTAYDITTLLSSCFNAASLLIGITHEWSCKTLQYSRQKEGEGGGMPAVDNSWFEKSSKKDTMMQNRATCTLQTNVLAYENNPSFLINGAIFFEDQLELNIAGSGKEVLIAHDGESHDVPAPMLEDMFANEISGRSSQPSSCTLQREGAA
jgi:hypothetical protein